MWAEFNFPFMWEYTIPNLKSVLWSFTRIIQMKYFAEVLKHYNHMVTMGFRTL